MSEQAAEHPSAERQAEQTGSAHDAVRQAQRTPGAADDRQAEGKPVIAFVGDSLTEEGDWAAWLPGYSTMNFGVSGDTTDDLLERLPSIIEARPDAVTLMIGTNDLGWRRTVEHVVRNIETVLVELRRELPKVRLLMQSMLPRSAEFADRVREVNRHLWQFSPTVYAHYLDLWPAMADDNGELKPSLSEDQLHLLPAGYEAWMSELEPALERLFELPPTSRSISIIRDEYARPRSDTGADTARTPPRREPVYDEARGSRPPESWSPS